MKLFEYKFNYNQDIIKYILSSNYLLSEAKLEKAVLKRILKGYTCKEIAQELNYSERTIQRKRASIFQKTKDLMLN